MPAVSEPALPHTWRPLGVRLAVVFFGGLLAVVCVAGWVAVGPEVRGRVTPYQQATVVLLNPSYRTVGVILPSQAAQLQSGGLASVLPIDQSLLLVWPQVVAIVGLTVACFAAAYVLFLRQEVRA